MKSFTTGRNLYGVWTKNTNTANLSYGDQVANDYYRKVCSLKDWPFLERLRTSTTTASTQFKALPYDVDQVRSVFVTISSKRYTPAPAPSRERWDELNLTSYTSDIPEYWFVYNGQLGLWPTPATSSNVISINAKVRVVDLSVADYTTGNIVSIANGATTVTGSGTTWTSQMTGRWIRITLADTANTGDGVWYEISSVTSATVLELVRPYGGTTIAAGSAAYTIGQMPLLPENFQSMPWNAAAATYWAKEGDKRAAAHKQLFDEDLKLLVLNWSSSNTSMVLDNGSDDGMLNPNLTISL